MNRRADFIIPECYIDTNLVETLVCPAGCNHQKGCNQVAKVMQEKFADRFAIGMIDADKRRPGYLVHTKNVMLNKDPRFKRLFMSMKDVGEMKLLESVLSYLISNPYLVSDDVVLNLFDRL
jgi:hypothetical protein